MKVLTIKQPYASLIIEGIKEYEFRTWKTNYRGDILIHAGKTIDKTALEKFKCYNLNYPTGCIIGKVTITDCIKIDDKARSMLKKKKSIVYDKVINNKDWNGYGFKLKNAKRIKQVKINGKLGLWNYDIRK